MQIEYISIEILTSCQKASYGQRYPCPALYSFWVEVGLQNGEIFHPSIQTSVCPSVHPSVPPLKGPRANQACLGASQAGQPGWLLGP